MGFDVNEDPVTNNSECANECDDCTDGVNSSAVEYGYIDIGDLSLVRIRLLTVQLDRVRH